jgi:hypothetical protein
VPASAAETTGASAPVSTEPTTWPIVTSVPAETLIESTPDAGDGTVTVALSVSSS